MGAPYEDLTMSDPFPVGHRPLKKVSSYTMSPEALGIIKEISDFRKTSASNVVDTLVRFYGPQALAALKEQEYRNGAP